MMYQFIFFLLFFLLVYLLYILVCILKSCIYYLKELTWNVSIGRVLCVLLLFSYLFFLVWLYIKNFGIERNLIEWLNNVYSLIFSYYKFKFLFTLDDSFIILNFFLMFFFLFLVIYVIYLFYILIFSYILISIQSFHYLFLSEPKYARFTLYCLSSVNNWSKYNYWIILKFVVYSSRFIPLFIFIILFFYDVFYNNCILVHCYFVSIFILILNIIIRLFLFYTVNSFNRQDDIEVQRSLLKNADYILSDAKRRLKYIKNINKYYL